MLESRCWSCTLIPATINCLGSLRPAAAKFGVFLHSKTRVSHPCGRSFKENQLQQEPEMISLRMQQSVDMRVRNKNRRICTTNRQIFYTKELENSAHRKYINYVTIST